MPCPVFSPLLAKRSGEGPGVRAVSHPYSYRSTADSPIFRRGGRREHASRRGDGWALAGVAVRLAFKLAAPKRLRQIRWASCRGKAVRSLPVGCLARRRIRLSPLWLALLLVTLFAACAPAPTPEPSSVAVVGQARTTDGPVLWALADGVVAAWVGADEDEVFQVARRMASEAALILPLPPRHPFAQQGLLAANDRLHLFWLDAGPDETNRLFSALLSPGLQVERGPVVVSDVYTQRYSVFPAADGRAFVAWSGGLAAEPALYTQRIDAEGRPNEVARVALDADWPALAADGEEPALFWLDRASGDLWRAGFDGANAARVAGGLSLAPGDRIVGVGAAADGERAVFAWNVTRADGSDESWATSGRLDAAGWPAPALLTLTQDGEALPVRWLAFAPGADATTAAAQVGQAVGLAALDGARAVGFTPVADLSADLIGPPRLLRAADGRALVAWAEPGPDSAALKVGPLP